MEKNVGTLDRYIRTLVAIAVGVLYYLDILSGTVAIVLGICALALLLTSLTSICPMYLSFGLSTRKSKS